MNSSATCHQVEGLPGLYIDAFKGAFLRKTSDASNAFVLTHYHGDHYQSLPRDGKYHGSALIHCTPVTAALLRHVHKVTSQFVVEHEYGIPWTFDLSPSTAKQQAKITFYDANHCPGAAIVAIQLPDGTVHLHTGDMRYHPRMKSYPIIQQAVRNRKLDLLYLDTTYGHPKHTFAPQEEAVDHKCIKFYQIMDSAPRYQHSNHETTRANQKS
jgi:DNA cross-link repair 1A protein